MRALKLSIILVMLMTCAFMTVVLAFGLYHGLGHLGHAALAFAFFIGVGLWTSELIKWLDRDV